VMGKIVPTAATMAEHALLNSGAMLLPLPSAEVRQALVRTKRAVHDIAHRRVPSDPPPVRDLARAAVFATGTGVRMTVKQRRFPPRTDAGWAQLGRNGRRFGTLTLEHQFEQVPVESNRIMLATEVDSFGRPRARLDWRWSDLDLASLATTQRLLAAAVERAGVGKLDVADWSGAPELTTPGGAFHPMGGTRMHASPRHGAVDATGRVHGVRNLFVCGSSTFPTGGYANPTLTVVALALRLAVAVGRELQPPLRQAV
jgi:choline dehydrogenase-like flavoprotein